jgi:hypothetical protein
VNMVTSEILGSHCGVFEINRPLKRRCIFCETTRCSIPEGCHLHCNICIGFCKRLEFLEELSEYQLLTRTVPH